MNGNTQALENITADLVAAVHTLKSQDLNVDISTDESRVAPQPLVPAEAPAGAHWARRTILANAAKLQALIAEPADFIQDLARQNQLLACINWLGEFQVLACIPLRGSVPFKDVAELAGVPEAQLRRVVRMTATANFLQEPRPEQVAHSALSAPFVTKPSYLDATMFLGETAAPAALNLAAATQRFGQSQQPHESAYNVAQNTSLPFASTCDQRPKLQRQWPAYLRHALGDQDSKVTDLVTCYDWASLGSATVVEVDARSTATALALADVSPNLRFVVQISEPPSPITRLTWDFTPNRSAVATPVHESKAPSSSGNPGDIPPHLISRISVEKRIRTAAQTVDNAAVYILRLPSPTPMTPSRSLAMQIIAELKAHLGVLRKNMNSRLLLMSRLLHDTGVVEPDLELTTRLRDLTLLQLANEHELETLELLEMVNNVRDGMGRLILVNQLRAWNNLPVGFEVQYQAYSDSAELYWPIATPKV